ncbi:MAG: NB-ARC domain-containing protein [Phormidesmis sp.]
MPRLSTSPKVKARIRILLKKLLEHADLGLSEQKYVPAALESRWIDETASHPKLVVKTKLSVLMALIASESITPISKSHVREVLLVLQQKLEILEDNRVRTQGSDQWDFTLRLWHTSVDRNLRKFEQLWNRYKAGKRLHDHPQRIGALSDRLIQANQKNTPYPLHNLPLRPDSYFVDTQSVLDNLLSLLAQPYDNAVISIVGPGGIGKTTLALEAAYRCLAAAQEKNRRAEIPQFDAIVFASAQSKEFIGPHLSDRWQADRTLKDIVRKILQTVNRAEGIPVQLQAQIEYVSSILKEYKTLLILDNLETVEPLTHLLAFVKALPQTVKVILTSRTRLGVGQTIGLDYLPTDAGFSLIDHQAKAKLVALSQSQAREIYQLSGGLPLAMAYSVGYLSVHRHLPEFRRSQVTQQPSEMARYCVESSLNQLQNQSAYRLLLAATLFTETFSIQAAAHVSALSTQLEEVEQGFARLHRLSLVNKLNATYYSLHSLTQDFVRSKLDEDTAFSQVAQDRWIEWYVKVLEPFSVDWFEWQNYDVLETEWVNVRSLVNWCMESDRYEATQKLWQGLQGYTLVRGYWDERQAWMDRLIQMAQARDDNATLVQALFCKGQTLAHLDEADTEGTARALFDQAWALGRGTHVDCLFEVATYTAAIYLRRAQFEHAQTWLKRGQALIEKPSELQDTPEQTRRRQQQQCQLSYYTAEIALREQNYPVAEKTYRQAVVLAEAAQWKRLAVYSKGWLSTVLLKRGKVAEAESLLTSVLESAQQYQDKRSVAQCYCNLALLAEQRSQTTEFTNWTTLAKAEFEQLNMTAAVEQMKQWLENQRSSEQP